MSTPTEEPEERPVQAEGVPPEEDVDEAEAARQVDEDPEGLANYTDSDEEKAQSGNVDADPSNEELG
jgi:hypothetical protein